MTKILSSLVAASLMLAAGATRADVAIPPPQAKRAVQPATPAKPATPASPATPEKKPAAAAPINPTPPAPAMAAPTPAPELLEMAKSLKGTWKCSGNMADPMTMTMSPATASITWKLDLENFWLVGTITMPKTKDHPKAMKVMFYRTFSAGKFTQIAVDSMGGYGVSMAGPAANGVMSFEGESTMGAMKMKGRDKEEVKGPKEIMVSGEGQGPDGKWMPFYSMTCKK